MDNEVTDSCDIPGWDKVDALAVALIEPTGLSVTPAQAETIIQRYGALLEYDKQPIQFQQTLQQKPLRGRFARIRQYRVGHVSLEKMKRYSEICTCIRSDKLYIYFVFAFT